MNQNDLIVAKQKKNQLKLKLEHIDDQISRLMQEKNVLRMEYAEIESIISKLESDLRISDHCVLRYFERISGHDVDEIRNLLYNGVIDEFTKNNKEDGEYNVDNMARARIKNCTMVTIMEPKDNNTQKEKIKEKCIKTKKQKKVKYVDEDEEYIKNNLNKN